MRQGQGSESARTTSFRPAAHGVFVQSLRVLLAAVGLAVVGCGDALPDEDVPTRARTADERALADRYREVVRLLGDSDAAGLCEMSTGEVARALRCASDAPRIPRSLPRAPRPRYQDLYIYSGHNGVMFGAPLDGRDDRLFVEFTRQDPSIAKIEFMMVGYSG